MSIHDWGKGVARSIFEYNVPINHIIEGEMATMRAWFAMHPENEFDESFAKRHIRRQVHYVGAHPEEFGFRGYSPKCDEIGIEIPDEIPDQGNA